MVLNAGGWREVCCGVERRGRREGCCGVVRVCGVVRGGGGGGRSVVVLCVEWEGGL